MSHLQKEMSLALAFIISFLFLNAQTVIIKGNVRDSRLKSVIPAASVIIKGTRIGVFTNDKGDFHLNSSQPLPLTLVISSIGFDPQEIEIKNVSDFVQADLTAASELGTEVVISASRIPERILESPVSIERIGAASIRTGPATNYYDMIRNLKGVDFTASSLTFSSVTTRGFNGSGNPRFNQFVDGMDNQAPGLNFSVGSVIGLTELDVDNMELLPGASSALYGSGGMNGTLLITSKDPFKFQGLSVQVKEGIMHLGKNDPISPSPYQDYSFRLGVKVNDKFAFKIGAQFIQAKDWIATDSSNYTGFGAGPNSHPIPGSRMSDPNYNGVNVYGDETSVDIYPFVPAPFRVLLPGGTTSVKVSRTGYKESEVIDNTTMDIRVSGGLYYKFTPGLQASLTGNYGTGNTVYTGSDRYSLKDLKMGQYKFELKADNWFLRSYATLENSGQAYNATVTTQLYNEAWSPSPTWYNEYTTQLLGALAQGASYNVAHQVARAYADRNRPAAGSAKFRNLFDQVRSKPIPIGGQFLDRTNMFHTEGQYNLTKFVKFAEVLVGGSWRQYVLNSQGTLFADSTGRIRTNEYGAYVQISKKLFDDKLKLTASGRYDKNDNFDGKFTPRFSVVYTVAKDNFIRASYQNAYRFPSNQNQWINLNTGAGILIGGLPQLRAFYHFDTNPVFNANTFQPQKFGNYKPESVNSYELGYKGLFNKRILLDLYGYYSQYQDFIGRVSVVQSKSGNPADINPNNPASYQGYSVSLNSANKVNTYGFGLSLDYLLPKNFSLNLNVSSDHLDNPDPTFVTYFNAPDYRFNLGVSNSGFGKLNNMGFTLQYRWQNSYFTESDFKQGDVSAFGTLDGQVSYKLTRIRSLIKLGATNILNKYYITAYGNPAIGGLYYVSFGYNIF